ncbi:MAG: peroxidase-related enzyme [Betaproteobacteria bacterium]|nr:peroxidase-related enzyme [Betaproteobacteria bacterium]
MSWIAEVAPETADPALAKAYAEIARARGKVANILRAHSLDPQFTLLHLNLYTHLMFGHCGLSRTEREAVAVAVSHSNGCAYCVAHHLEALQHHLQDEATLAAILDARHAQLPLRLAALLDYARTLTECPEFVDATFIERLHHEGLNDDAILRLNLVVGYFNLVNRIALGLGVAIDDPRGFRDDSEVSEH